MGAVKALLMDALEARALLPRDPIEPYVGEPCRECGGDGYVEGIDYSYPYGVDSREPVWARDRCPACRGDGYEWSEEEAWLAGDDGVYPAAPPSLPLEAYEGEDVIPAMEAHHV